MLIYGKQPIYYLLEHHPQKIKTLYLAKEVDKKEYSRLMRMGFEIKRIPANAAQSMSKSGNHQGFLAEIDELELTPLQQITDKSFVVILSGITDVGNIGAIIRSAYALGVEAVIVSGLKQFPQEPVMRSSTGALMDMPVVLHTNILDVMNELKQAGFDLYGAVMNGTDAATVKFGSKRALILGSEGEGISKRAEAKLDHGITITMAHAFDSLNVSAAGAILMDRMK
ncbi:MAG: 23S rRNA (guanosine(2251)-2'-O)-methyltransferase RlmB [Campylobacterota bacterium]|nr:23S rRNA (guanosine(2251)-2'-O)-methyltransferase RlmB [Campylobacterota bacterium]